MAGLIILLGSVLGFLTGVAGYVALDVSLLSCIAIWALSGPLSLLFVALLPSASAMTTTGETKSA